MGDFKHPHWAEALINRVEQLDQYNVVIIHQALHELRHKSYAQDFHRQVKKLINDRGVYFVCDHLYAENAMQNNELYMSKNEHINALTYAGFSNIRIALNINGLCLFECHHQS